MPRTGNKSVFFKKIGTAFISGIAKATSKFIHSILIASCSTINNHVTKHTSLGVSRHIAGSGILLNYRNKPGNHDLHCGTSDARCTEDGGRLEEKKTIISTFAQNKRCSCHRRVKRGITSEQLRRRICCYLIQKLCTSLAVTPKF